MTAYVKTFFIRGLFGIFLGLSIGYTVLVLIAGAEGQMFMDFKSLSFHYFMAMFVGFYMGSVSVVYDVEEWSLLRQTVTHGILILPYIPLAFSIGWAPRSFFGRLLFILMYIVVYGIIWLGIKTYWSQRARELNEELNKLSKRQDS